MRQVSNKAGEAEENWLVSDNPKDEAAAGWESINPETGVN